MFLPVFVCLSVCLSVSKITQKRVHGSGWNVVCRQMSGHGRTVWLLSPIRFIIRMPEPDCFLRYRINAATRNFVGKIPRIFVLARPDAAARRGFKIVLFTQPSNNLCRRYMRFTGCPSSFCLISRTHTRRSPHGSKPWRRHWSPRGYLRGGGRIVFAPLPSSSTDLGQRLTHKLAVITCSRRFTISNPAYLLEMGAVNWKMLD